MIHIISVMAARQNQLKLGVFALLLAVFPCSGDVIRNVKSSRIDSNGQPIVTKPPVGKRITAEELAERRRKIDENRQYIRVKNENIQRGRSVYDGSVILAMSGVHTIVPEGAIAYVPDHHSSKVVEEPSGKFVLWPEFLKANGAWLRTVEITYEQATGAEPVNEQRIKALRSAGVVVVTQYKNNPISFRGKFELPTE